MATSIRALAIRSSKWNKSIDAENIVLKIRDNLEYDREFYEDHEPDWKYCMWWPNKVAFVNVSDGQDHCENTIKAGHETHAILNIAIQGYLQDEVLERC